MLCEARSRALHLEQFRRRFYYRDFWLLQCPLLQVSHGTKVRCPASQKDWLKPFWLKAFALSPLSLGLPPRSRAQAPSSLPAPRLSGGAPNCSGSQSLRGRAVPTLPRPPSVLGQHPRMGTRRNMSIIVKNVRFGNTYFCDWCKPLGYHPAAIPMTNVLDFIHEASYEANK